MPPGNQQLLGAYNEIAKFEEAGDLGGEWSRVGKQQKWYIAVDAGPWLTLVETSCGTKLCFSLVETGGRIWGLLGPATS